MAESLRSALRETEAVERVALWAGWLLVLALMFTAPAGTKAFVIVIAFAAGCTIWTGCVYLILGLHACGRVVVAAFIRWLNGRRASHRSRTEKEGRKPKGGAK